jgi:hypothetical protein
MATRSALIGVPPARQKDGVADRQAVVDLQEHHGHVVVLRRIAHERLNLSRSTRSRSSSGGRCACAWTNCQPRLAEAIVLRVHRLADAVREEQVEVARVEDDGFLLQQALEHRAVVDLQADHQAIRCQNAGLPGIGAWPGHVNQRCVAGACVRHGARLQIDDRVRHRDEASGIEVLGDDPVGADQHLSRRRVNPAERQHEPLELGHIERGRRAFAGHVCDEQAEPVIVEGQEVVVVAAHFARRHAERRDGQAGHRQRPVRQQRQLDFLCDAQLFLSASSPPPASAGPRCWPSSS